MTTIRLFSVYGIRSFGFLELRFEFELTFVVGSGLR